MENNFKSRLLQEALELRVKVDALDDFISNSESVYHDLENEHQFLLSAQLSSMECYLRILDRRVELLNGYN